MSVRYITDEPGKRVGVALDIEEYERLLEIEDELDDLAALQPALEPKRALEAGDDELIPWDQALEEVRTGETKCVVA